MMKLYEISALVNYHVVIAAKTKEEALKEVETWEHSWDSTADLIEVTDVDVFDIREPYAQADEALEDEAHVVVK